MRNRFTNLGWLTTIVVAVLLPVIIWIFFIPSQQWSSAKQILENLGKIAGIVGMVLLAWNIILSSRLKAFDKLFLGLDNTYRAHHLIGSWAFIFLLLHPVLITQRYLLSSPISAYEFIKPSFESPYRLLGEFALFMMVIFMIITLYLTVRHKLFILVQRLLALILFLGGLHAIFVGGSDINKLSALQIYILILLFLAAVVYIYRSLFHGNFNRYFDYGVESITPKGDSISEIILKPLDKKITFLPGQFAFLKFEINGELNESHPFSFSSAPQSPSLRFSIKKLGEFTQFIEQIPAGTIAKIDGPYGTFSYKTFKNKRQVWVAGGIGITPFLSMATSLQGDDQKVDLYYCVKDDSEAVYLGELSAIADKQKNLRMIPIMSNQVGLLTAQTIFAKSDDLDEAAFLICGPKTMMSSLRAQLRSLGVANRYIHTEEFDLK